MSYDYYYRALAGDLTAVPNLNQPAAGFYRHKNEPVAYFLEQSEDEIPSAAARLLCIRGRQDRQRQLSELEGAELWQWVAFNPVPEVEWRDAYAGKEWSDEAPGLGHNRPPDDLSPEAQRDKVLALADEWLEKNPRVSTPRQADQCAHYITEVRNLISDLDREEKPRKQAFDHAKKELMRIYDRAREPLIFMRNCLDAALRPFLLEQDKAHAAAREREREAREAARAAGQRVSRNDLAPPTRVGGTGHAVTLRSYWHAEIESYIDAMEAAGLEPEVRDAVQKVANRYARESQGKNPLPGTRAIEERR